MSDLRRSGIRRILEKVKPRRDFQVSEEAAIRLTRVAEAFILLAAKEAWLTATWYASDIHANGNGKKRLQDADIVLGVKKLLEDPQLLTSLRRELGAGT